VQERGVFVVGFLAKRVLARMGDGKGLVDGGLDVGLHDLDPFVVLDSRDGRFQRSENYQQQFSVAQNYSPSSHQYTLGLLNRIKRIGEVTGGVGECHETLAQEEVRYRVESEAEDEVVDLQWLSGIKTRNEALYISLEKRQICHSVADEERAHDLSCWMPLLAICAENTIPKERLECLVEIFALAPRLKIGGQHVFDVFRISRDDDPLWS
jgi:hypothetical protein